MAAAATGEQDEGVSGRGQTKTEIISDNNHKTTNSSFTANTKLGLLIQTLN